MRWPDTPLVSVEPIRIDESMKDVEEGREEKGSLSSILERVLSLRTIIGRIGGLGRWVQVA